MTRNKLIYKTEKETWHERCYSSSKENGDWGRMVRESGINPVTNIINKRMVNNRSIYIAEGICSCPVISTVEDMIFLLQRQKSTVILNALQ